MMRKIVTLAMMVMAISAKAGDNHIAVADIAWGGDSVLTITLDNEDAVNGLQLDLSLPGGFAVAVEDDTPKAVPSARLRNHSVVIRHLRDGRYRLLVFSMGGKAILGHRGKIVTIPLRMTGEVPKGSHAAHISGISFSFEGHQVTKSQEQPDIAARLTVQ